ncbi:MAG: GNAT family N-acetyltransferase [Actinobacteria bacterium]|nr:GNAT family N-acetyltransferase [Actinomycetota bacterium]
MGVMYMDEAFANVRGAVDPGVRGNGIGGDLLEALLSEISPELTVMIQPTDVRTAAPALLSKRGFHCEDAGVVETFLHDLAETPSPELDVPDGYDLTTVFGVPSEDLERVIHLEKVWCMERSQPVGPRLIGEYSGPQEGFVVLARETGGEVVGLANVEMTNVQGLGLTELFVVDPPHRRRGIGRALKAAQLLSARQFGWREVLATVPEAEHPATRINAELGGLGMDGLRWVREPLT